MDREDAKKVIKNLSEKPFICADDWIEVAGGYLVTTKAHFDKLEKAAATERRKKHVTTSGKYSRKEQRTPERK